MPRREIHVSGAVCRLPATVKDLEFVRTTGEKGSETVLLVRVHPLNGSLELMVKVSEGDPTTIDIWQL